MTALGLGACCAESYARLTAPYDAAVARLMAWGHPWTIVGVDVVTTEAAPGAALRLVAEVRRYPEDALPAAIVVSRLQVGAAIEVPLVFWSVLLIWPSGSAVGRVRLVILGFPIFLAVEAVTTVASMMDQLPVTSAILANGADALTLWQRWSRFLEAGGRLVIALCAALLAVAACSRDRYGA